MFSTSHWFSRSSASVFFTAGSLLTEGGEHFGGEQSQGGPDLLGGHAEPAGPEDEVVEAQVAQRADALDEEFGRAEQQGVADQLVEAVTLPAQRRVLRVGGVLDPGV